MNHAIPKTSRKSPYRSMCVFVSNVVIHDATLHDI